MIRIIIIYFLVVSYVFSVDFKVATYNVENLFDMKNDGTEYKEYKPNSKYWNTKSFDTKVRNIVKVIKDLDADILALQEIENINSFNILKQKISTYKYSYFLKKSTTSIGVAILSKYKIINNKSIQINKYNPYSRPILKTTININDNILIIYVNHWRSKRASESKRIPYGQQLIRDIRKLKHDSDYIILGDLNSNYDEYLSMKYDKKLNDTYGITAINQVLNTSLNNNLINKNDIYKNKTKPRIHYNLWLDLEYEQRFSSKFRGKNNTPDNIILPHGLFDNKNISYINNSFGVFKKDYLYKNNKIIRWNMRNKNGYSDHLPIYALFSTMKQDYKISEKKLIKDKNYIIDDLYKIQNLSKSVILNDVVVIYKYKNIAIIKAKFQKAILIYSKDINLKEGYKYDLNIDSIMIYKGLKEITKFRVKKKYLYQDDYRLFYMKYSKFSDISYSNQNEIITNLTAIYKNNKLIIGQNKIKIYFSKGINKPKENSNILIKTAIISVYHDKLQLRINKQSDFKVNFR